MAKRGFIPQFSEAFGQRIDIAFREDESRLPDDLRTGAARRPDNGRATQHCLGENVTELLCQFGTAS